MLQDADELAFRVLIYLQRNVQLISQRQLVLDDLFKVLSDLEYRMWFLYSCAPTRGVVYMPLRLARRGWQIGLRNWIVSVASSMRQNVMPYTPIRTKEIVRRRPACGRGH